MNILVLTEQWFVDYAGGSGRVATETVAELSKLGHTVTVVAPRAPGQPARSEPYPGVALLRIVKRGELLPQTLTDPFRFRRAYKDLGAQDFDLVIVHQPSGVFAARSARTRLAFVFHASALREARHRRSLGISRVEQAKSLVVERMLQVLEFLSVRRANVILVLSRFSEELIKTDHPPASHKVVVAGGGIDTDTFVPSSDREALRTGLGVEPSSTVILTVRRLVARTGVANLLHTFAKVHRERPDTTLVIVGDGEERDRLRDMAIEMDLGDRVRFLGRVSDSDVVRWYQASDLFVLPTIAYEGFGMSTAEALACGTPVIGTPVGATRELLDPIDPSLVSSSAEPTDLAAAVLQALPLLSDARRQDMRSYAVKNLSSAALVSRWLDATS